MNIKKIFISIIVAALIIPTFENDSIVSAEEIPEYIDDNVIESETLNNGLEIEVVEETKDNVVVQTEHSVGDIDVNVEI